MNSRHEGPGRDHSRHLAELAAKHLDVVEVGGLKADHRRHHHCENGRDIFPVKAGERDHVAQIERNADET